MKLTNSTDFVAAEAVLDGLEKQSRDQRDRAVQLRREAQQLEQKSGETLKARSEFLQEMVIAELVRRNLSCCGSCGKVTSEVAVCSIYESASPTRLTIWRLCLTCQKAVAWEFDPQVFSSGNDVTANELLCLPQAMRLCWKNLSPVSAKEAFGQLKKLAEREDPTRDDILRHHIND